MLEPGIPAPEFVSVNQDGDEVALAQYLGDKHVVLYFYPRDDTPGCTVEANEFTALIDEFAAAGAIVLGVSKDTCAKHKKFIAKHDLRVELLSDESGELSELYGAWGLKKFMGREFEGILRSTFVIDKQGVLRHVDYQVKAKGHAAAILDIVRSL